MSSRRATDVMLLRHLALPVRDRDRSMHFYSTYFGFIPASARSYPDGTTVVRDDDGFDLALHPVAELDARPDSLHFGFRMSDRDVVRELRIQVERDGVPVVESDDEPDLVSFKCLDPDGWQVEVYWEQT